MPGVGHHLGDLERAAVDQAGMAADDEDDGDVGAEELLLAGQRGAGGDLLVGAVGDEAVAGAEPGVEGERVLDVRRGPEVAIGRHGGAHHRRHYRAGGFLLNRFP